MEAALPLLDHVGLAEQKQPRSKHDALDPQQGKGGLRARIDADAVWEPLKQDQNAASAHNPRQA